MSKSLSTGIWVTLSRFIGLCKLVETPVVKEIYFKCMAFSNMENGKNICSVNQIKCKLEDFWKKK
jgi:hypothetical protein